MSKFRQSDVTRFVRAVEKATGQKAAAVKFDLAVGTIIVIVAKPDDGSKETELDNWIEKHHAHDA